MNIYLKQFRKERYQNLCCMGEKREKKHYHSTLSLPWIISCQEDSNPSLSLSLSSLFLAYILIPFIRRIFKVARGVGFQKDQIKNLKRTIDHLTILTHNIMLPSLIHQLSLHKN